MITLGHQRIARLDEEYYFTIHFIPIYPDDSTTEEFVSKTLLLHDIGVNPSRQSPLVQLLFQRNNLLQTRSLSDPLL